MTKYIHLTFKPVSGNNLFALILPKNIVIVGIHFEFWIKYKLYSISADEQTEKYIYIELYSLSTSHIVNLIVFERLEITMLKLKVMLSST